jgi:hypothetical protein
MLQIFGIPIRAIDAEMAMPFLEYDDDGAVTNYLFLNASFFSFASCVLGDVGTLNSVLRVYSAGFNCFQCRSVGAVPWNTDIPLG